MGMYRRVLCELDLDRGDLPTIGERARAVLQAADSEAHADAELVVLHALPVNPGGPMSPEATERALVGREQLTSVIMDAVLAAIERLTSRDPAGISVLVEDGPADRTIVECAARAASDLIVIGRSGAEPRKGMRRLLGSVASAVVREAPCSVLVVHGT